MTRLKYFLVRIIFSALILALVGILAVYAVSIGLKSFTKHGEKIETPSLIGKSVPMSTLELKSKQLSLKVTDTIYSPDYNEGDIVEQHPTPLSFVKSGREILVKISTKQVPKTTMPNLVDLSIRQATVLLKQRNLELSKIRYVQGYNGLVYTQLYKGDTIQPGTILNINSPITLVVGQ